MSPLINKVADRLVKVMGDKASDGKAFNIHEYVYLISSNILFTFILYYLGQHVVLYLQSH